MRILLQEVGKLRDERRALQQCVVSVMSSTSHVCSFHLVLSGVVLCVLVGSYRNWLRNRAHSEISELMAVKSKYDSGGEYTPGWAPSVRCLSSLSLPCRQSLICNRFTLVRFSVIFDPVGFAFSRLILTLNEL